MAKHVEALNKEIKIRWPVAWLLLAGILVYIKSTGFGFTDFVAFLSALIFVVHPVLTQAVVWIPGRNDSLLAVFGLLSILCFIKYAEEGKLSQLLLHFLFLIISLLTKETAISIPLICIAY